LKAGWNSNNNLQIMPEDDNLYYNIKNKKSNNSFVGEPSKFINENSGDKNES
jgi:hypothetical protein